MPAAALAAERVAFAFFPHRRLHSSWRDELLADPWWQLLAGSERSEGRLAAFVTERLSLGALSPDGFETPQARFCLMPGDTVLKVALRLGLALNAARLVKVIDGRLVARIRHELGAEAYEFALKRAPLITTQVDPLATPPADETALGGQLERSGINYIGLSLAALPSELRERFAIGLPKAHATYLRVPRGEVEPATAWQAVRKIVREVEPEWSALLE